MKPRILVVDDEPAVSLFTSTVLGRPNCDVETANSAEKAVQQLNRTAFDLVVTNYRMPGESGEATVVAAPGRRPSNPVIIMTGWIHDLPPSQRIGPSAGRILAKPFTISDLCRAVSDTRAAVTPS